ncbi:MAG: hypothetical protein ACLFP2_04350 [Candidatus Woesearchaeota archaeon]
MYQTYLKKKNGKEYNHVSLQGPHLGTLVVHPFSSAKEFCAQNNIEAELDLPPFGVLKPNPKDPYRIIDELFDDSPFEIKDLYTTQKIASTYFRSPVPVRYEEVVVSQLDVARTLDYEALLFQAPKKRPEEDIKSIKRICEALDHLGYEKILDFNRFAVPYALFAYFK